MKPYKYMYNIGGQFGKAMKSLTLTLNQYLWLELKLSYIM